MELPEIEEEKSTNTEEEKSKGRETKRHVRRKEDELDGPVNKIEVGKATK